MECNVLISLRGEQLLSPASLVKAAALNPIYLPLTISGTASGDSFDVVFSRVRLVVEFRSVFVI